MQGRALDTSDLSPWTEDEATLVSERSRSGLDAGIHTPPENNRRQQKLKHIPEVSWSETHDDELPYIQPSVVTSDVSILLPPSVDSEPSSSTTTIVETLPPLSTKPLVSINNLPKPPPIPPPTTKQVASKFPSLSADSRRIKGALAKLRPGGNYDSLQVVGGNKSAKLEKRLPSAKPVVTLTSDMIIEASDAESGRVATFASLRALRIARADPTNFHQFDNLRAIDLTENEISDLNPIAELRFLRELHLGANRLARLDVRVVDAFLLLEVLDVSYNLLDGSCIHVLSTLPSLRVLSVTGNDLSAWQELRHPGAFARLELLSMNACHVTRTTPVLLSPLPRLRELYLVDNRIDTIPYINDGFLVLEKLDLSGNPIAQPSSLAPLCYLPRIKQVVLLNHAMTGAPSTLLSTLPRRQEVFVLSEAELSKMTEQDLHRQAIAEVDEPLKRDLSRAMSIAGPGTLLSKALSMSMSAAAPSAYGDDHDDDNDVGLDVYIDPESSSPPPMRVQYTPPTDVASLLERPNQFLGDKSVLMGTKSLPSASSPTPMRQRSLVATVLAGERRKQRLASKHLDGHERKKSASRHDDDDDDSMDLPMPNAPSQTVSSHTPILDPVEEMRDQVDPAWHERIVSAFEQTLIGMASEGVLHDHARAARVSTMFSQVRASMMGDAMMKRVSQSMMVIDEASVEPSLHGVTSGMSFARRDLPAAVAAAMAASGLLEEEDDGEDGEEKMIPADEKRAMLLGKDAAHVPAPSGLASLLLPPPISDDDDNNDEEVQVLIKTNKRASVTFAKAAPPTPPTPKPFITVATIDAEFEDASDDLNARWAAQLLRDLGAFGEPINQKPPLTSLRTLLRQEERVSPKQSNRPRRQADSVGDPKRVDTLLGALVDLAADARQHLEQAEGK